MEMQQIRYFLALCEERNFTRAAERCNVAQPSLTRAIKMLDEELGGPLFHRERAATHLSELGRLVTPHLEQVFALLARVAEAIVATVGPACEAVVHDLRNPEHTVVAIAGNLTRREIGSPVPEPAMLPGQVDRFTEDWLCDSTRTLFGKELLASTVWVRDERGHIVGSGAHVDRGQISRHLIDLRDDLIQLRVELRIGRDVREAGRAELRRSRREAAFRREYDAAP